MLDSSRISEGKSEDAPFGPEIQAAVKAELRKMLSAPFFSQSARCRRFLSHVVLQTLSGKTDQLKERMIGISVFDRATDYNTGEDAIVRVTANEVRKRIGQFYQESGAHRPVQIDLPRGSYIPEFRFRSGERDTEHGGATGPGLALLKPSAETHVLPIEIPPVDEGGMEESAGSEPKPASPRVAKQAGGRLSWPRWVMVIVILGTFAALAGYWKMNTRKTAPDIWEPFVNSKTPVLVCLGTHNLPYTAAGPAAETEDAVMREETIPIDDVSVVSSMARLLGNKGIAFHVAAADRTSLTDLQNQPVVLIGAVDNQWTIQMTESLPYRISVEHPLGPGKPPIAEIKDSKQPVTQWSIDFSVPLSGWKSDYAIVARYNDTTIGVPVLMEAGLGNDGSLAASRFVASADLASALRNEPSCSGKDNFEAIIGTEIIDTRPGVPHLLRLQCW